MTTRTRATQSSDVQEVTDLAPVDLTTSAERLTRFEELARTLRSLPQAARMAHATELNELLIAMRAPGHETEESELILELLASKTLEGLVDEDGRSCRNEAVETMLASGFPHALALDPEDVAFARAWSASKGEQPLADWELLLLRNRRRGAATIVIGQVLGLLLTIPADLFRQWPRFTVGLFVLTITSAAVLGVARPRSSNVGVMGGALAILCLVHLLFFGSTVPTLGLGVAFASLMIGVLVALGRFEKEAPPDPDEPNWGPRGPPSWWGTGGSEDDPWPANDPWGRSPSDWNYGRDPTYGEKVPNPKGDFWKVWEGKQ